VEQWFSTFSLKGAKSNIQFCYRATVKFYHKSIDMFCFIAEPSLLHKILEV